MHQCGCHLWSWCRTGWSPSNLELPISVCERWSPRKFLLLPLQLFHKFLCKNTRFVHCIEVENKSDQWIWPFIVSYVVFKILANTGAKIISTDLNKIAESGNTQCNFKVISLSSSSLQILSYHIQIRIYFRKFMLSLTKQTVFFLIIIYFFRFNTFTHSCLINYLVWKKNRGNFLK